MTAISMLGKAATGWPFCILSGVLPKFCPLTAKIKAAASWVGVILRKGREVNHDVFVSRLRISIAYYLFHCRMFEVPKIYELASICGEYGMLTKL